MNVFVLNTGRCGSKTLYNFCKHITNYSAGHESTKSLDLVYNKNHIEIDNRLSWFLGRLDEQYGNNAIYVHLKRDEDKVAKSFTNRLYSNRSLSSGYKYNILNRHQIKNRNDGEIFSDLVKTINKNITLFLKDKDKVLEIHLDKFENDAINFWNYIQAEGDLESALKELQITYNTSPKKSFINNIRQFFYKNLFYK